MKLLLSFVHGDGHNRIDSNPFDEILNAADRACALVVAAICEKRIEQALRGVLRDDPDLMNMLFQPDGPLGAFKPKTALAYAADLISPEAFHDLKIIAGIRNDFAHKFAVTKFDEQSVAGRCANLKLPELHYGDIEDASDGHKQIRQGGVAEGLKDPRSRYVAANMLISNNIALHLQYPRGHEFNRPPYI
ncbi:MAG: hypothetical protein WC804_14755 [Sphingomonas sp.]|jgi:DNA-binding MltR family transcriptional regulator|uniref:hypothetical protein n=1 Tax=Sphingomonas sp. TaxID=28214 RepID=UPI003567FCBF